MYGLVDQGERDIYGEQGLQHVGRQWVGVHDKGGA